MPNNTDKKSFYKWWCYQYHRKKNLRLSLERFLAGPSYNQIIVAAVLFIAVFLLVSGFHYHWKFDKAFADMSSPVSLRSEAYHINNVATAQQGEATVTIQKQDPALYKSPAELIWIYLIGTIVLSGLLIATITNVLRSWVDRYREGTVSYSSFRNHIIILGYNDMVPGMIERMCGDRRYPNGERIVVGVKHDVQEASIQLSNQLSPRQRRCVVVLQADSCNRKDLKRIQVHHAKEVYILGEHDDAYSLKSFNKIQNLRQGKRHHPECYVQMQYQSTFALFQTYTEGLEHFHAFNYHDVWARQMVMRPEIDTRDAGATRTSSESEKQVHIVIIGMTEMGEAIAREAALLCHYPNFVTKGIRTKITLIDFQAEEHMTYFKGRYHNLFDLCNHTFRKAGETTAFTLLEKDFLDIEFEFIEANIADEKMQRELSEWAKDEHQILTIAVCADLPHRSMAAGLYLPDAVFDHNIPVWIYQPSKGDMKAYLKHSRFDNITTFGMTGLDLNIKNEEIISQAKRLNHFYYHCSESLITYNEEEIDREWNKTIIFNKWSNIYNVSAIPTKLRSIGGLEHLDGKIETLAQVEHNRWNVEKLMMGFRPTTDEEHQKIIADNKQKDAYKARFIHDDIRPFNELSVEPANTDRKFVLETKNIIFTPQSEDRKHC